MKKLLLCIWPAAVALLAGSSMLLAGPEAPKKAGEELRPYVLPDCIVSGRKLESDALCFKYGGREIRTCCDMCMDDFFRDPENWVERIAEAEKLAAKKADKPKKPAAKPPKR